MAKYDGILICTDLDNTLLNSEGKLSEENFKAAKYFCENGGKFCVSTGRWPEHLLKFFDKEFFNCPIICCNGACIYDFKENKILYERFLCDKKKELGEFLLQFADRIKGGRVVIDLILKEFANIKEMISLLGENIHKILIIGDSPDFTIWLRDTLKEKFGEFFDFSRSWPVGLEVLCHTSTKGDAVDKLKQLMGKDYKTICVGDYENDITMIQKADIGVAVANALDIVKEAADKVICSNDEHAIKYIVENICDKCI